MRYLAVLIALFVLASCRAQVIHDTSRGSRSRQFYAGQSRQGAADSVVQFLLTSCAADFRAHRPPDPIRFRRVRVGHYLAPDGRTEYMLCGEFLPGEGGKKAKWTPFATIQTSGYEQYLGPQAVSFCRNSAVTMDKVADLSPSLQDRFDSLRKER